MPNYQTPGVYIQEIDSGAKPLEAAATSNAAFLGVIPVDGFSEVSWSNSKGEAQLRRLPGDVITDAKAKVADVGGLISSLGLDSGDVKDLGKFGGLFGLKPKVTIKGDQATVELGKGKVDLSAADVDAKGRILVKDKTKVASIIDELTTKGALEKYSPSTVNEVVDAFGGDEVSVKAGLTRFSVGPTKVTNPTQFNNIMRMAFEEYIVEINGQGALKGDEERLDALYIDFLNIPEVFNFVMGVSGFFKNGGGIAYTYLLCAEDSQIPLVNPAKPREGLGAYDDFENDIQIMCGPGLNPNQQKEILEYCEMRADVFAILDGPKDRMSGEEVEKNGVLPASDRGYGALYVP